MSFLFHDELYQEFPLRIMIYTYKYHTYTHTHLHTHLHTHTNTHTHTHIYIYISYTSWAHQRIEIIATDKKVYPCR